MCNLVGEVIEDGLLSIRRRANWIGALRGDGVQEGRLQALHQVVLQAAAVDCCVNDRARNLCLQVLAQLVVKGLSACALGGQAQWVELQGGQYAARGNGRYKVLDALAGALFIQGLADVALVDQRPEAWAANGIAAAASSWLGRSAGLQSYG